MLYVNTLIYTNTLTLKWAFIVSTSVLLHELESLDFIKDLCIKNNAFEIRTNRLRTPLRILDFKVIIQNHKYLTQCINNITGDNTCLLYTSRCV